MGGDTKEGNMIHNEKSHNNRTHEQKPTKKRTKDVQRDVTPTVKEGTSEKK